MGKLIVVKEKTCSGVTLSKGEIASLLPPVRVSLATKATLTPPKNQNGNNEE